MRTILLERFASVRGARRSGRLPLLYLCGKLIVRHGNRSSTLARIPGPHHQLVFREVLNELIEVPVSVLLWILDRLANLRVRQPLPDHRRARRWQTPVGRARWQMSARKIMVLMTSAAFFRSHSVTLWTSPHIHGVLVSIIALPRKLPAGMTIHTAWVS